jgi:hypothetical protein
MNHVFYDVCVLWFACVLSVSEIKDYEANDALNNSQTSPQSDVLSVSCGPPILNQRWQMASGYIGAALMLLMAVYARYIEFCCFSKLT